MATSTNIFISSAYEYRFRTLRSNLKLKLNDAGHNAIIFEDGDFAPWDKDTIKTCVQKVKECDLLVLLISQKKGTFINEQRTTPTYIEFHTAKENGLYILPFVDSEVHELYFQYIRDDLNQRVNEYFKEFNRFPDYFEDIVDEIIEKHPYKNRIEHVDNYIWGFLKNIEDHCGWLYKLDFGDTEFFYKEIKRYLSDRLALGIRYVPLQDEIIENAELANVFKRYQKFTLSILELLGNGNINNWRKFLENIVGNLFGGEVKQLSDTYISKVLVHYKDCNAVSLYKFEEDFMKLVEDYGKITSNDFFDIHDTDSFVVDTYLKDTQNVYYDEQKQLLYFTIKAGIFVLCFHFPLQEPWTQEKVYAFRQEYYDAIIKSESSIIFNFVTQVLGGIKND